jgi:hypothetical protein
MKYLVLGLFALLVGCSPTTVDVDKKLNEIGITVPNPKISLKLSLHWMPLANSLIQLRSKPVNSTENSKNIFPTWSDSRRQRFWLLIH